METWMTDLPDDLTRIPMSRLSIPGTHDSCSYCIDESCDLSQDNEAFAVLSVLGKLGRSISSRWARTQDGTVLEQLRAGFRYFDFRVLHRYPDDLFFFVHGQFAKEVTTELFNIRTFLQEHPREVVLLDFNHLYCFSGRNSLESFESVLIDVFGSMLAPRAERVPSLSEMLTQGHQVICLLHAQTQSSNMWRPESINSPWPNTVDLEELLTFLAAHPPQTEAVFHVTQGVLTPSKDYILKNLDSDLQKLATLAGEGVLHWLPTCHERRNIVIIDFAVKAFPGFAQTVIDMNNLTGT